YVALFWECRSDLYLKFPAPAASLTDLRRVSTMANWRWFQGSPQWWSIPDSRPITFAGDAIPNLLACVQLRASARRRAWLQVLQRDCRFHHLHRVLFELRAIARAGMHDVVLH